MRVVNVVNQYSKNLFFPVKNNNAATPNTFLPKKSNETAQNIFMQKRGLKQSSSQDGCRYGNDTETSSLLSNLQSYGEMVRTQRQTAKNTSLAVKKLKYQFKNISSRIIASKTSAVARQVAGQATREVLRLKREKQSGNYDSDEIEAAIVHAKAMERIARKKVRHLEEEELARAGGKAMGGVCAGDLEEKQDELDEEKVSEDAESENDDQEMQTETGDRQRVSRARYEEELRQIQAQNSDMNDLMQEMSDDEWMNELSEELSDALLSYKKDLDPADLKMMIVKHRNKEMREIAEADSKYLKAYFNYLEKLKGDDSMSDSLKGADSPDSFGSMGSSYTPSLPGVSVPVVTSAGVEGADIAAGSAPVIDISL